MNIEEQLKAYEQEVGEKLIADDVRQYLNSLDNKVENPPKKVFSLFPINARWRYAASLLLIVSIGAVFWYMNRPPQYEQIAQDTIALIDSKDTFRGTPEEPQKPQDTEQLFKEARTAFDSKNYPLSIQLFEALEKDKDLLIHDKIQLGLALSYLANKNIEQAKSLLTTIAQDEKNLYKEKATELLKKL